MGENWKPIVCEGYEGLYEVSNLGSVKSLERIVIRTDGRRQPVRESILKKRKDKDGYDKVYLSNLGKFKNASVHRLVAQTFIDNPLKLPEVNHINSIRDDNRVENLEWVTSKENSEHAYEHGYGQRGLDHKNSKQVIIRNKSDEILTIFESITKCEEVISVNKNVVNKLVTNNLPLFDDLKIEYTSLSEVNENLLNINPFNRLLPQVNSKPIVVADVNDNIIAVYPSRLFAEKINGLTKSILHRYKKEETLFANKYYIKELSKYAYMMSDDKYINIKFN